jgi:hypothetical protein
MRKTLIFTSILFFLLLFSTVFPSLLMEIQVAEAASQNPWYVINNGWINVTKTDYKWAASNSSNPKEYIYFYRYSNSTPFQDWRGFIWSESLGYGTPAYTFGGQGTAYLLYNDSDVLSYKRVLVMPDATIEQYYTFWRDTEYFSLESRIISKINYVQNQIQFGVYITSDGSNTYAFMGYKDGEVIKGRSPNDWGLGSLPVTSGAIESNKAFPWQAVRSSGHNCSVGWTLTFSSSPWTLLSAGKGGDGELQFETFYSNPASNGYFRLPYVPFESKIGTIVYPFYGEQAVWYEPVQTLARSLYSSVSAPQSFEPLYYAYGQHDPSSSVEEGTIANRIGVIALGWTSFNGFFLKDTTTWNYYPDVEWQPMYIRAGTTEWPYPDMGLTTDTGTTYLNVENSPLDSSSQSVSRDSTPVWLKFSNDKSNIGWDVTIETWGDSDKFNVTMVFRNKVSQNIKDAWTYFRTQDQINPMEFQLLKSQVTADYVINDPYRGYCGYLIERLEGNASGIDFSQAGAKIHFLKNTDPTPVAAGTTYTVKLMLWAHYGKITSESQITDFHTNPTLSDSVQHFAYSPSMLLGQDSKLYIPYNVWNSSATFPKMEKTASSEYTLTAISDGVKTYALFLNRTVFNQVNQVSNVDTWSYDPTTGNLTFSATFQGVKKIKINLQPPPPPPTVAISPEYSEIQLGQSVLLTSSASQGLPPYTYQWYVDGTQVQGANQSTYLFAPVRLSQYRIQLQVYDGLDQKATSNVALVNATGGYKVNLQVLDWNMTDKIQGAEVYLDSDMQKSDSQGWANWTGVFGTVGIKVKYQGYWVNGVLSLNVDSDATIGLQCKLFDVVVSVKSSSQEGSVYLANVAAFSTTNDRISSGVTGIDGKTSLANVPNGTSTFTASSATGTIAAGSYSVNAEGQSVVLVVGQNYGSASLLWQQTSGSGEVVSKYVGDTNFEMWSYLTLNANYKYGSRFQFNESGAISMISANIRAGSGTSRVKACVYGDNNGAPDTLKGVSTITTIDTTRKWWNFSFSTQISLTPGYYWLCLLSDTDVYFYADTGASRQTAYTWTDNFSSGPATVFGQTAYENYKMNIFATVNVGSGTPADVNFYNWSDGAQKSSIALSYDTYAETWNIISNASYGIKNSNATSSKVVKLWVDSGTNTLKIGNFTVVILDSTGNVQAVWTTATWSNLGEASAVSWTAISNNVYTIQIWVKGSSSVNGADSTTINLRLSSS